MRSLRNLFVSMMMAGALATASAAVFTVAPGGSITATIADFGGGNNVLDVRGAAFVGVGDPNFVNAISISDSTGGTDPGFAVLAFGNNQLFIGSASGTEFASLDLNFATAFLNGSVLNIAGVVTPVTSVTAPELALTVGASPLLLSFEFVNSVQTGNATVSSFLLSAVTGTDTAVPEPASMALAGLGLSAVVLYRRKRIL